MTNHILDLSESPAYLHVNQSRLVIDRKDEPPVILPLAEVAVLIAAHAQVKFTQAVLAGLASAGGVFVVCDTRRLPVGMMLPLDAHHWQVTRFTQQAVAKLPTKKRLWQQVVRAKIIAQAGVLEEFSGADKGLRNLADEVRSGDPSNVEAQAARRYWSALFGEGFRRDREAADANLLLNYGYGVLRAIVARAICAAGLHPSLGLHHHHRASGYPLADDLMEPFRAVVDRSVVRFMQLGTCGTDTDNKQSVVRERGWRERTVSTAASLAAVFMGERRV